MKGVCVFVLLVLGSQAASWIEGTEKTGLQNEETVQNDEEIVQNDEEFLPRHSDHWQEGKSLREAMEYLFVYKAGADVTFVVTDQTGPSKGVPMTFKAHRTVLMARSSAMSRLLTNVTSTAEPVSITDVDPEAFRQMLKYMYTDQPHITADNVLYVATAARKYNVPGLQTLCGEYLRLDLSESTVLGILKQGMYFNDRGLIRNCLDLISGAASSVLHSPGFLTITPDMMAHVVALETINATEVEMFRACFLWAGVECLRRQHKNCSSTDTRKMREILEPFIYHIRFPSMSIAEFTDEVVVKGVLSAEEISLIYQQMVATTPPQSPFKAHIRGQPVLFRGDLILKYQQKQTPQSSQSYHHRLDYSPICFVNKNITLFKIHSLKFNRYSENRITIKQNNKDLYTHHPYRNNPETNNFDDDDIVSLNLANGVNIDEGNFIIAFRIYQKNEQKLFESFPGWQKHESGEVEWWCNNHNTPFYGLQYQSHV